MKAPQKKEGSDPTSLRKTAGKRGGLRGKEKKQGGRKDPTFFTPPQMSRPWGLPGRKGETQGKIEGEKVREKSGT